MEVQPKAPIFLRSAILSQGERASVAFLSEKRGIAFLFRERPKSRRFLQLSSQLMFFHQGKVLNDSTTLDENKVAENTSVSITFGKNESSSGEGSTASSAPTTKPMLLELGKKNHHLLPLINEPVEGREW